jgi:hypothetical protein
MMLDNINNWIMWLRGHGRVVRRGHTYVIVGRRTKSKEGSE